jgi:thiamine-monophosphate kinase
MRLQQIGELNLLSEIKKRFSSSNSSILVGIGDDAAVIAPQKNKIIVTTDMMNEGVHFDLSFTSFYQLGFKLVSVNVSDIFAMGCIPRYLFLNVALSKDVDDAMFWQFYEGISEASKIYSISLAGGDLCSSKRDLILSATVIGFGEKIVTRSGASVGDNIYVTGNLGDSACGFEVLKRLSTESKDVVKFFGWNEELKKDPFLTFSDSSSIELDIVKPLIKRHLIPIARNADIIAKYATAMIDISDGLFIDLHRLCQESDVGAKIYLNKIPVSEEMKRVSEALGLDLNYLAGSGGEDYELLFTAPKSAPIPDSIKIIHPSGILSKAKITFIGEIVEKEKGKTIVNSEGKSSLMEIKGYQHFLLKR